MKTSEIVAYFEAAAKSNKLLHHQSTPDRITFRRMNIREVMADECHDLKDITMILENPKKRTRDALSDNPRKLITVAFLVMMPVEDDDFDGEVEAMDKCELISEQMFSKIRNDITKRKSDITHQWALKGIDLNSIVSQDVHYIFGKWHGWRNEITIDQSFYNNMMLNNADWTNDTKWTL
jgi:hypothetical protein